MRDKQDSQAEFFGSQIQLLEGCIMVARARKDKEQDPGKKEVLDSFIQRAIETLGNLSTAENPDAAVSELIALARELGLTVNTQRVPIEERIRPRPKLSSEEQDIYKSQYEKLKKICEESIVEADNVDPEVWERKKRGKGIWQYEISEIERKIDSIEKAVEKGSPPISSMVSIGILTEINTLRERIGFRRITIDEIL